ncbi:MAG: hypothetical protein K8I27_15040 [Planctomycetes bacterium]|nr:hypothetical protein [Planctomycetota bacterium]
MKKLIVICALALLIIASCEDSTNQQPVRFVDQTRICSPDAIPLGAPDKAVQTEAMTHMNLLYRQITLKAQMAPDKQAFYRSLAGTLDATKLGKLGLTENEFKGTYYTKASDYSLSIVGNQLTITAAQIGSRGRVDPQTFKLP